ncbi:hypothetical protein M758_3G157000 [Ceratodon purpureus]|nr:hypothetical protein M758_3G157000 [Ceratodon purpureus]
MAGVFIHVVGKVVLLYLAALLVMENPRRPLSVEAYEMVFSNQTITDLTTGAIDVAKLITGDWLALPLGGSCGLAAKYITPHVYNTSTTRGTLHTTFEYLTQECTAEYKHDINTCALLNADFAVCLGFPFDSRTSKSPWGYCSNQNSRVSYLWVPDTVSNSTTTSHMPMATSRNMPKRSQISRSNLQIPMLPLLASPPPSLPPVCLSHGQPNKTATNPVALAKLHKDTFTLNRMAQTTGSKIRAEAVTSSQSCDWRHSNIIPVAWDGIQNVLLAGQSLQSPDGTYALTMQYDCNLVVYKKRPDGSTEWNAKWASFSQFNDPFQRLCYLEMQPDGNLVVKDPLGAPRWSSGSTAPSLYSTALSVISCGNVIVLDMTSGAVVWATHTGHT